MIRISTTRYRLEGRNVHAGYCAVVCDACGLEGPRRWDTSDFDVACVSAEATVSLGWTEYLDGRFRKLKCSACSAPKAEFVVADGRTFPIQLQLPAVQP